MEKILNRKKAAIEVAFVLGFFFALRQTLEWFNFSGFEGIVSSGNVAVVTTTLLFLGYLKRKNIPFSDIGIKKPDSWKRFFLVLLGAIVALVILGLWVFPFLFQFFPVTESNRFFSLQGDLVRTLMTMVGLGVFAAAFCEEVLFRGIILTRLARAFGNGKAAWAGAILLQAVIFGLIHLYLGSGGLVIAGSIGLIFGLAFVFSRFNIWPSVMIHLIPLFITFYGAYLGR